MKPRTRAIVLFLGLLLVLAVPIKVFATPNHAPVKEEINGNKILIDEAFILMSNNVLNGQILAYNSEVTIQTDSVVNGQVVLLGGTIQSYGQINGNLICIGCSGYIGGLAEINGNLVQVSSKLDVSPEADISGFTDWNNLANINLSNLTGGILSAQTREVSLVSRILTSVFGVLAISALGVLVTVLFPKAVDRTASTSLHNPGISLGIGCLSIVVWIVGFLILTLTIIFIPVSLISIPLLLVAVFLGWISLGHEVGRRINSASQQKWPEPVITGIGLLILGSVVAALNYIPCLGGLLSFLLAMVALGAVVLSRMGTFDYPGSMPKAQSVQGSKDASAVTDQPPHTPVNATATPPPLPTAPTTPPGSEKPVSAPTRSPKGGTERTRSTKK
jgi:hypothetical protein